LGEILTIECLIGSVELLAEAGVDNRVDLALWEIAFILEVEEMSEGGMVIAGVYHHLHPILLPFLLNRPTPYSHWLL
jgi:hypothetical protein